MIQRLIWGEIKAGSLTSVTEEIPESVEKGQQVLSFSRSCLWKSWSSQKLGHIVINPSPKRRIERESLVAKSGTVQAEKGSVAGMKQRVR